MGKQHVVDRGTGKLSASLLTAAPPLIISLVKAAFVFLIDVDEPVVTVDHSTVIDRDDHCNVVMIQGRRASHYEKYGSTDSRFDLAKLEEMLPSNLTVHHLGEESTDNQFKPHGTININISMRPAI